MASETRTEIAADAATETAPQLDGTDVESAPAGIPDDVDVARALEAILMIADEPQSVVGLAAGVGRPVADVRAALAALVADYDGEAGGPRRGFELREITDCP